ncbi:MAG: BON domain-containing protein [Allorhizobium sp.]
MVFKPQTFHGDEPEVETEGETHMQSEIETAVADLLAVSDGIDATGIAVICSGDEIFLHGRVAFAEEIARAVDVAMSVPGVGKVTVDLVVGNPGASLN